MRIESRDFKKEIAILRKHHNITTTRKKWKYIFVCPDNRVLYSNNFYTFEAMDEMPLMVLEGGELIPATITEDGEVYTDKVKIKMEKQKVTPDVLTKLGKALIPESGHSYYKILEVLKESKKEMIISEMMKAYEIKYNTELTNISLLIGNLAKLNLIILERKKGGTSAGKIISANTPEIERLKKIIKMI